VCSESTVIRRSAFVQQLIVREHLLDYEIIIIINPITMLRGKFTPMIELCNFRKLDENLMISYLRMENPKGERKS